MQWYEENQCWPEYTLQLNKLYFKRTFSHIFSYKFSSIFISDQKKVSVFTSGLSAILQVGHLCYISNDYHIGWTPSTGDIHDYNYTIQVQHVGDWGDPELWYCITVQFTKGKCIATGQHINTSFGTNDFSKPFQFFSSHSPKHTCCTVQ